jgi:formylglycine-generating enzyme required for sulfatase activity
LQQKFDVFLSYHWRDHREVESLAQTLRQEGLKVFLDRWYLTPGQPWPQALERALASCSAVVVCVGPGDMGPWQQRETYYALEQQAHRPEFPVIPVLLPGADPALGFLAQNTWVDLRTGVDQLIQIRVLAAAIRGEPPGPEFRERIRETRTTVSPYRGLAYFREEDAPFFFGRDAAIETLYKALQKSTCVALIGASGSGKSSVVRAGLVPRLRAETDDPWETVTIVPGDRPLYNLAARLVPLLEPDLNENDQLIEIGKQAKALQEGALQVRDVVERILHKQLGTKRFLLIVDQWEELYTLTQDAEARQFMDSLLAACGVEVLSVVLTLRGDFVGRALGYRPLTDRLQDAQVLLGPMCREELQQAIEAPAAKVGAVFEAGLVERILDDVGDEPGHLPLLEFVLQRLWEDASRHDCTMRHEAYNKMGGLTGALANTADAVYAGLSDQEQQAAQQLLLQLVCPGVSAADTRRRATFAELDKTERDIVKRLADKRLLVTSRDSGSDEETVEVAHEALIRHWQTLRRWLDRDREFLLWRERLRQACEQWRQMKCDRGALLRGARLAEAERWLKQSRNLTDEERHYIRQSVKARTRQKILAAGIVMLSLLSISFVWWYTRAQLSPHTLVWLLRARIGSYTPQPQMVDVPAGSFLMGSPALDGPNAKVDSNELPQHRVTVHKPFRIGKFEVTFDEYDIFAHLTGRPLPHHNGWGRGRQPVINVAWDDAQAYTAWLRERTGKRYRLPTEAEWEYAARAGTTTEYWWGNEVTASQHANCATCGNQWSDKRTAPVGSLLANPWGLHDTAGNVWEWAQDCMHENYQGAPSESGKAWENADGKCPMRMLRGGAWNDGAWFARSAVRLMYLPDYKSAHTGFRLAQDLD